MDCSHLAGPGLWLMAQQPEHTPQIADINPFLWTNTWELCWLRYPGTFWPPGIERPHSLTCGSSPFHQWAPFRQESLLRSRFLRVPILNLRALSLSCSWLTHATTPTLPIILSYITSVLLLHTTPCMFFNFLFVESAVLSYISAWIYWRSGWLDSYVAKIRGQADMRTSTPQSSIRLKKNF